MLNAAKKIVLDQRDRRRKKALVASGGADAAWYDQAYSTGAAEAEYTAHWSKSRYLPVWEAIAERTPAGARVLEVGCGSGQLAQMLLDQDRISEYVGFDFSATAVGLAKKNLPGHRVEVADARDTPLVLEDYDTVICTEVLEHIVDDLLVLERIPSGRQVLGTVPDFDYESHVRFFADADEVRERYWKLFSSLDITVHHHTGDAGGHHGTFFLMNGVRA